MFVDMAFSAPASERAVLVPKAAVQTVGGRQVVFIPAKGEDGKFIQRAVRRGPLVGEHYAVASGLSPGELVVTEGSFLLRAESARNGPPGDSGGIAMPVGLSWADALLQAASAAVRRADDANRPARTTDNG